jgi:hypothetical protein
MAPQGIVKPGAVTPQSSRVVLQIGQFFRILDLPL